MTTERLAFLDVLRAVAIVLVVAIHARAHVALEGSVLSVVNLLIEPIAVPAFFAADGFLFLWKRPGRTDFDFRSHLAGSVRRLLVPWILFSSFYALTRAVLEQQGVLDPAILYQRPWSEIISQVWGSQLAPQMYFLVSLFLIRTAAPVLRLLDGRSLPLVAATFLIYTFVFRYLAHDPLARVFDIGNDPVLLSFWGLQFYLLGMTLARAHESLQGRSAWLAVLCAATLAATLGLVGRAQASGLVQYAYLLLVWFAAQSLGARASPLCRLGRESMGIYLLHAPIVLKALALAIVPILPSAVIAHVALTGAAVVLSYASARIIVSVPHGGVVFGIFERRGA